MRQEDKTQIMAATIIALLFVGVLLVGTQCITTTYDTDNDEAVVETVTQVRKVKTPPETLKIQPVCEPAIQAADSAHLYLPNRKHHDAFHRGIDWLERILHRHCSADEE